MNKNLTEIIFIIDKSGSMNRLTEDTIGGFNGVLESQRESVDGEAVVTTVLFNGFSTKLHDRLDIREVEPMTRKDYIAGGSTALLDAIGQTIQDVQDRIDELDEKDRPAHVVVAITTDGEENASTHYTKERVQKMVTHQTRGHGWEFLFLGANMDAIKEAATLGITYASNYVPDSIGTRTVYTAMDSAIKGIRTDGTVNALWSQEASSYYSTTASNASGNPS